MKSILIKQKVIIKVISLTISITALAFSALTSAHHSFAIYDFDTQIEFKGTVETLKFKNPHLAMTLKVITPEGEEQIVNFIEGAPANMLVRSGLRPSMIVVGTEIIAIGSPLLEDSSKFFLRKIILNDGSEF